LRQPSNVNVGFGLGCLAALLRRARAGGAWPAFAETEVHVLLEFLQLLFELAGLELHLLDLPVELPHLAFEPANPDKKTCGIRLRAVSRIRWVRSASSLANLAWGPAQSVALRKQA
jgi:hypothetical protein